MQLSYGVYGFLVVIFVLSSCRLRANQEVDSQNIALLKKKYSAATINYFYETVFHEDEAQGMLDNLSKWKSDPQIVLSGNPSAEEVQSVKDAITRINQMKLYFATQEHCSRKDDTGLRYYWRQLFLSRKSVVTQYLLFD